MQGDFSTNGSIGYVDVITDGHVSGWGIDPSGQPATILLFSDDTLIGDAQCHSERPDLAGAGLPTANAGFHLDLPDRLADGRAHVLSARFPSGEHLQFIDGNGAITDQATVVLAPRAELHSHVDGLVNGALRGWAARRYSGAREAELHPPLDLVIEQNGFELARLKTEVYRPDVAKAMNVGAHCGFAFRPPARLRDGRRHQVHVRTADTRQELDGSPVWFQFPEAHHETRVAQLLNVVEDLTTQLWRLRRDLVELQTVERFTLDDYNAWSARYRSALRARRAARPWPADRAQPLVSVVCPVYRPRLPDFQAAVASVLSQTYRNIEFILVDDNSRSAELSRCLKAMAASDPRVKLIVQKANSGISGATNVAIAAAKGAYVALFDHDDLLEPVAVEVLLEAALETGARVAYSDEDKIDDEGRFSDPHLKGDWNHRLALAQNYVCHFLMIEAGTLAAAGPLRAEYDGAQDHDLVLRLAEAVEPHEIVHVPEIIYHWRITPGSTAQSVGAKSYAIDAGARAVRDHLRRRGHKVKVGTLAGITMYEVEWSFKKEPSVTIVIPFRDQAALTRQCLDAVRRHTRYGKYRIVLVDNWSASGDARAFAAEAATLPGVDVLRVEEPFNYSRLNNLACEAFPADFFVFMNNDVFVDQKNWLRLLVNEALADEGVGAVGAKLLYPDRTVQHGGVILGVGGVGDHAYRGRAADDPFFMGRGLCGQELSAVTGALMLCRAEAFKEVGGFDETELAVAYNDIDLCLKLRAAGRKVLYCPAVVAEHRESVSRGDDMSPMQMRRFVAEERVMLTRWTAAIGHDPFYNPLFSRDGNIFMDLADPARDPRDP